MVDRYLMNLLVVVLVFGVLFEFDVLFCVVLIGWFVCVL